MSVTRLGNLAVKVSDLDAAIRFYQQAGADVRDRGPWAGGERADAYLGPLQITLFTRAIYEDEVTLPPDTFLHVAVFTDDLDGGFGIQMFAHLAKNEAIHDASHARDAVDAGRKILD